jgi:hypothetical protein
MTLRSHVDKIYPGDNVVIGLGDSFTQGVGAYSLETWNSIKKNAGTYNISGQFFVEEQGKNNWVRQLAEKFLPGYKTMSLGVNGAGNRAAVKELYLNPLPPDVGHVIVILMSTGIERFDFLKNNKTTSGPENHQKWKTIWPSISSERADIGDLEMQYAKHVWSEKTDAIEFLLNVAEAQSFCKANNYTFLFGSAFEERINKKDLSRILNEDLKTYIDTVDWDNYICPTDCTDFMNYIRKIENNPNITDFYNGQLFASKMSQPLTYITPCYHWTIEGSNLVAKEIYKILKEKKIL